MLLNRINKIFLPFNKWCLFFFLLLFCLFGVWWFSLSLCMFVCVHTHVLNLWNVNLLSNVFVFDKFPSLPWAFDKKTCISDIFSSFGFSSTKMGALCSWFTSFLIPGLSKFCQFLLVCSIFCFYHIFMYLLFCMPAKHTQKGEKKKKRNCLYQLVCLFFCFE